MELAAEGGAAELVEEAVAECGPAALESDGAGRGQTVVVVELMEGPGDAAVGTFGNIRLGGEGPMFEWRGADGRPESSPGINGIRASVA